MCSPQRQRSGDGASPSGAFRECLVGDDVELHGLTALSYASPADQPRDHPVTQDDGLAEDLPTGLDLARVKGPLGCCHALHQ
jgi:hypothetical protein